MMEGALIGIVREALEQVAEDGLPGAHHFYITFRTGDDGVEIDDFLRSRYPEEMTIVLQHQFWDLDVGEDRFSILLSFNDTPSKLVVPYAALTAFIDPSVKFGLQFDDKSAMARPSVETGATSNDSDVDQADLHRSGSPTGAVVAHIDTKSDAAWPAEDELSDLSVDDDAPDTADTDKSKTADPDDDKARPESAEVVTLDQFRRKK